MMRPSSLVALALLLGITYVKSSLHEATVRDIRGQIRQLIDDEAGGGRNGNDLRFLGGLVRLAFHDCVGNQCDGCINSNHPDNAGLDVYINGVEELYSNLEVNGGPVVMSRADFWTLAGIEAVYYSAERANPNVVPNVTFYTGRVDCATSPSTSELHDFPSALGDTEHVLEFFDREFGFDVKEATAILGAHTLGSAHSDASGFIHPWVPQKDRLNNAFYADLRDSGKGWNQRSIGPPDNRQWFWETAGDPKQLMLNADIALIKNMSGATATGMVNCDFNTCDTVNTATVDWVNAFAADNSLWIDEFSKAFQKMIAKGWEGQLEALVTDDSTSSTSAATGPISTTPTVNGSTEMDNAAVSNASLCLSALIFLVLSIIRLL